MGVAGQIRHDALTQRLDALAGITILRSALRRVGARKRRRLDVLGYESRIVVAAVDVGPLHESSGYRVSVSELDVVVQELGGYQRTVDSASVRFLGRAQDKGRLEDLHAAIDGVAIGSGGSLMAAITASDTITADGFELPGVVTAPPGAVEAILELLHDSAVVDPWHLRARWHDQRRKR